MNTREDKFSKMKEYFTPICSEISFFDEDKSPDEWFTKFNNGCILFSLINGKFKNKKILTDFNIKPNENFKVRENRIINKKHLVKGVTHEYKSILIWYLLTKNNVLEEKLSDASKKIKMLLNSAKFLDSIEYAYDLKELYDESENKFAMKNNENFNYSEWDFDNLKAKVVDERCFNLTEQEKSNFLVLKKNFLSHLPKYSLICSSSQHWRVFLGIKEDRVIMCDSKIFDGVYSCDLNCFFEDSISVLINKNNGANS